MSLPCLALSSSVEAVAQLLRGHGLFVRPVEDADFADIVELLRSSFPEPFGWWHSPARMRRYLPEARHSSRYGPIYVRIAEGPEGDAAGCICYQRRSNDDLYIIELAANPSGAGRKRPLTGTALLLHAMTHGSAEWGAVRSTLSVSWRDARVRADHLVPNRIHDLAKFYGRLGYEQSQREKGYALDCDRTSSGAAWFVAPIARVREAAASRLAMGGGKTRSVECDSSRPPGPAHRQGGADERDVW